jgi:hypothetical protein
MLRGLLIGTLRSPLVRAIRKPVPLVTFGNSVIEPPN